MGASGWDYQVDYQEDVGAALQALKEAVFARGAYFDRHRAYPTLRGGGPYVPPGDVAALMARNEEDGSHSILDMERVGDSDDFGVVRLLSAADRRAVFGTEVPTRADMREGDWSQLGRLRRWRGRCTVTFDAAGRPDGLYFCGVSGD